MHDRPPTEDEERREDRTPPAPRHRDEPAPEEPGAPKRDEVEAHPPGEMTPS